MDEKTYKDWIDKQEQNFPYYNPAPSTVAFPIMASSIKYDNDLQEIPKENMVEAHECGFNVCIQEISINALTNSLKNAGLAEMRIMTLNIDLIKGNKEKNNPNGIDRYTGEYKRYLGGIPLFDEPKYKDMTEPGSLQNDYYLLQKQNAGVTVWINLLGGYNTGAMPDKYLDKDKDYELYVRTFQEYFKPAVFSFDYYPIREENGLLFEGIKSNPYSSIIHEGHVMVEETQLYKTLKLFSDISKEHQRPFWAYCMGMCHSGISSGPSWYRPVATENQLRYESFNAIAYGAKGLAYWTYAMRPNGLNTEGEPNEIYLSALLDRFNRKTASWYFAQKINKEILRYANIFLNAESLITKKLAIFTLQSLPLLDITIANSKGKDLIFTQIKNGVVYYIMVCNTDPLNYQEIEINLIKGNVIELTPLRSVGPRNTAINTVQSKRVLIPGGYRIFKATFVS